MVFLKVLILFLTFNESIFNLDAKTCPKGQKVALRGYSCEPCPVGYYQPVDNDSQQCKPCTRCAGEWGSVVKQHCTRETDTTCQCLGGFVPRVENNSICKCDKGRGIRRENAAMLECLKCEKGFFSNAEDTQCQKWKDCKAAGVKLSGSETSDNVCNEEKNETHIPELTPSNTVVPFTRLTTHRPHEGAQTQKENTATATTSAPGLATTKEKMQPPSSSSNSGSHIGMALVIFGISGLLVLTVVTCRLHITTRWQKKTPEPKDSLCRRPVEESGDGSRSSLKQNPEEP